MASKKAVAKALDSEVQSAKESVALTNVAPPRKELVLEGDPEAQLAFAMKAANALMKAVKQKPKPVMIRGEQYLEYGDWQTLARFFGATASVSWTKPLTDEKGKNIGYEARAEVLHQGQVISSAEAMCTRDEANWKSRDEFMLRSMAQTRASAKALRNAYGWVAELAGMKSTPAEEMDGVASETPKMAPYRMEKKAPAEPAEGHDFLEKEEVLETQKAQIKQLLLDLNVKPLTIGGAVEAITDLTKLPIQFNYNMGDVATNDRIIAALKKLSPIEQLPSIT